MQTKNQKHSKKIDKISQNTKPILAVGRLNKNEGKRKFKENQFNQNEIASSAEQMKAITSDPRFSHIVSDPKYRNVSKKEIKIPIDNRFKAALTNENYSSKFLLDPRGRPKSYATKEKLDKFYDLNSSDNESDEEEDSESDEESDTDEEGTSSDDEEGDQSNRDRETKLKQGKENYSKEELNEKFMQCLMDPDRNLARGEKFYSDDSSDDDSSTTDEEAEPEEFEWGELDADAQWDRDGVQVEETNRFAICDMDWDQIKAVDLMVLFHSFLPAGGTIRKVTIYPSEYGKSRMQEEEVTGPLELVRLAASKRKTHGDDYEHIEKIKKGTFEESSEATTSETEALRRYQRNRLRYFYAVAEFDSVDTATAVYKECDRTHYEVAGVTLDLRYIPSDMEFNEIPHDECLKVPDVYESEAFKTSVLLDSKPVLTWDETDPRRQKALSTLMTKALKKQTINEEQLKGYIGSSNDEESEDDENDKYDSEDDDDSDGDDGTKKEERIAKFRALISEMDEKARKKEESLVDMECTFNIDEKEREEGSDSESETNDKQESINTKNDEKLTPFEKYIMKRKEKRKEKIKKKKKMGKKYDEDEESESDERNSDQPFENTRLDAADSSPIQGRSKLKKSTKTSQESGCDLSLLVMDEENDEKKHFDMRKILEEKKKSKKKGKKKKSAEDTISDQFKVDSTDPRFSALFSHTSYNLDPSHPKYDPHSTLNSLVSRASPKRKRISQEDHLTKGHSITSLDPSVSNLVKKIKSKISK